jgi:hypothetical protein
MPERSRIRPSSPYPGPRAFKPEEEDWFRGRQRETSDLYYLVAAQRVALLYAQSGAGKTSLVNAGLLPRFEREGVPVKTLRVGLAPLRRVRGQSIPNIYVYCALHSSVPEAELPADARLSDLVSVGTGNTVLVFDQFEEIFTRFPERWADREGFFQQVAELLDTSPQVRVLFVVREEYLAETDVYGVLLPGGYRVRYHLERLRADKALEAIVEPAHRVGYDFGVNVAEKLVKDLQTVRFQTVRSLEEVPGEFVEPVQLQIVCTELWKARRAREDSWGCEPGTGCVLRRYSEDRGRHWQGKRRSAAALVRPEADHGCRHARHSLP